MKDKRTVDNSSVDLSDAMDTSDGSMDSGVSESSPVGAKGVSRRTLAKAGASAPLLMSLFSRPVLGATTNCFSADVRNSADTSGRHEECDGKGCRPTYWKDHTQSWNGTGCSAGQQVFRDGRYRKEWNTQDGTTFYSVFGFHPTIASRMRDFGSVTLMDVLLENDKQGNSECFESHMVAAYLNAAKAPFIYGANCEQVVEVVQASRMGTTVRGVEISEQECHDLLLQMNNTGDCFLNSFGECGPGYVEVNGTCVPACPEGSRFDVNSRSCVRYEDWDPETCKGIDD